MATKNGWGLGSWQDKLVHLGRYTDDANRAFIAQRLMKGQKPPHDWKPQPTAPDFKSNSSTSVEFSRDPYRWIIKVGIVLLLQVMICILLWKFR
eukprot:gnl/MRDRNA2_/MRDRNA2_398381_c0_seq1.p1 gnl/MRDRNA2_/MRDRNA2_398381_c0~~gnl/MRDRNA2_/MRDRNA2_398381_c0_seq1.p1  ORF type:complete len:104 (-),score=10.95 gnl/MRDRNA2_/MRDRNA2_398381_c0_seq1:60-341(-)